MDKKGRGKAPAPPPPTTQDHSYENVPGDEAEATGLDVSLDPSPSTSSRSERSREFRQCFSIIESEMEGEALHYDKKKPARPPSSALGAKGKRKLKAPSIFRKRTTEAHPRTSFYDEENELIDQEEKLLEDAKVHSSEICTLRREVSGGDSPRQTIWTRDSICDPTHRSTLPEIEQKFLEYALEGNVEGVNDLLNRTGIYKDFIECRDELGRTALHLASTCGRTDVVKVLLEKGAQIEVWDANNTATPLMCAASSGNDETLKVLLQWKNPSPDINTGYENGKTALYWACSEGHYDCAKTLLEHGAKQSATAIFSETPLHVTATRSDPRMLKLLLDHGADVTLLSGAEKNTALHLAAQESDLESCKLLLHAGAPTHVQNSRGLTPLHFAAFGFPSLTEFLLVSGANPNIADNEGRSPAFYSVGKGNAYDECLDLLLTHNANVNLQDQSGYSPLHIAAVKEAGNSAAILLRFGADLTLKNMAGQTALALFTKRIPDAMKIFKDYLDDCITITTINFKANVKLDFSALVPSHLSKPLRKRERKSNRTKSTEGEVGRESELLRCFQQTGMEEVFLHPLVEAFLQLKWRRLRKFFILSFLLQMILVLFYSSFILELYKVRCPYSRAMTIPDVMPAAAAAATTPLPPSTTSPTTTTPAPTTTAAAVTVAPPDIVTTAAPTATITRVENMTMPMPTGSERCEINSYFIWSIVVGLCVLTILKEIIQFVQCPGAYVHNLENWALLLFLACVSLTVIPPVTLINAGLAQFLRYQYPIAALGGFLAWTLVFIHIGKFPSVGLYVQMFIKVGANFVTFLLVYGCLLIAFAMAFALLFPAVDVLPPDTKVKTFGTFWETILKQLRIMTGDVNLEYLLYDDLPAIRLMPSQTVANFAHTTCVVVLSIVLMNLLVGLAVSDVQGLYLTAKLKKLSRQAELIAYLESFILSKRFLCFLFPSLRKLLLKSAIVAPTYYKCFFYFHPNDKEDKRLPEDLKSRIIRLKDPHPAEKGGSGTMKGNTEHYKKLEAQMKSLNEKIDQLLTNRRSQ